MCYVPACVQSQFRLGEAAEVRVQQHREGNQEGEDDDNDVRRIDGTQSRQCLEMDPQSLGELENMVLLNVLNEAALLHNVRKRYAHDAIYTTVGDILVAVNPFKQLPIYDKSSLSKYIAAQAKMLPPHIYTIADHA